MNVTLPLCLHIIPFSHACVGKSRREILSQYSQYARKEELEIGRRIRHTLIKPVMNLFHSEPNGKLFRQLIDTHMKDEHCTIDQVILRAAECLSDRTLDATAADAGAGDDAVVDAGAGARQERAPTSASQSLSEQKPPLQQKAAAPS